MRLSQKPSTWWQACLLSRNSELITTTPNALVATVNHEISLLLANGSA